MTEWRRDGSREGGNLEDEEGIDDDWLASWLAGSAFIPPVGFYREQYRGVWGGGPRQHCN